MSINKTTRGKWKIVFASRTPSVNYSFQIFPVLGEEKKKKEILISTLCLFYFLCELGLESGTSRYHSRAWLKHAPI